MSTATLYKRLLTSTKSAASRQTRRLREKYDELAKVAAIGGGRNNPDVAAGSERTSITDDGSYPSFCQRAAGDPKLFARFRSHPQYAPVLENVSESQGRGCLNEIVRDRDLMARLPALIDGDDLGGPTQFSYEEVGLVSPTTLRYLKVLADLRRLFGNLDGFTIAEIGVGYGGQCRMIARMYDLSSYELIDLPPVNALAERFLQESRLSARTLRFRDGPETPPVESDLLISNYAFSELRRDIQEAYFERVVNHAIRGYVIYNHTSPKSFRTMTAEEFAARIPGASIQPEVPLTHPNNVVVVWGTAS